MQRVLLSSSFSFSVAFPKFDYNPPAYKGTPYEKVFADRQAYVPHFNTYLYKQPLLIT